MKQVKLKLSREHYYTDAWVQVQANAPVQLLLGTELQLALGVQLMVVGTNGDAHDRLNPSRAVLQATQKTDPPAMDVLPFPAEEAQPSVCLLQAVKLPPRQKKLVRVRHCGKVDTMSEASPIVLVAKDGSTRLCMDYRCLNAVTKMDVYPLPHIDDSLDLLAGNKYFTTLDLASGYWQVRVEESDREKTAFTTHNGLYEFVVMPFGLCNAPATFQRLMENILHGLVGKICLVYINDILVMGTTLEEHLENLRAVLTYLHQSGPRLKPSKLFQVICCSRK